jgi:hypothetical protein
MNSKVSPAELNARLNKSLTDLLDVLGDIDESDIANNDNEWSIDDNNGGRITLNYDPTTKDLRISKGRLNLIIRTTEK